MSDVTVGIDIGTTAVKAVAAAGDGTVLARARVPHEVRTPAPGSFEHDIGQAWRANVLAALGQVATGLDLAAVNVSAMVPSLGAVRADGTAAGPGLLYGDRRGEREGHDASRPGDSGELLAFLAWHARNSPGAVAFWPAQAVANHALAGRGAIDSTTAMTAHPLFDFVGWDERLAAEAGVTPGALPEIVAGVDPVGRVRDGVPGAGALVGGGTIDALAEQLVAGADTSGDVLVLCGTTLITWGVLDEWQEVAGLWTVPHTAAGKSLIGGPSNAGGLFLDSVRGWLGAPAGMDDVDPRDLPVWLPYVRGERTPLHRRDLRAAVEGIALHHSPGHLLRGAYEAAGFVVRHHLDLARPAGLAPRRIVATGGGTQDPVWMRALADCTGLPVHVAAVPEGAALGSAFVARCVAGLEASIAEGARWARTARTVEPEPAWADAAGERYRRFRAHTAAALEARAERSELSPRG
ncbi:MAG TPA: FGGY-family carbohydrate kinase [Acidimicrobiales bacterium]|nr:FGGY-family carbohydrate kinase [Acidimicrobiales bacterium]